MGRTEEGGLREPATLDDGSIEQRQDYVATAKDQRAGAIEAGEHGGRESAAGRQAERGSQQDHEENCGHGGARAGDRRCKRRPVSRGLFRGAHQEQAGECACSDSKHGGIGG